MKSFYLGGDLQIKLEKLSVALEENDINLIASVLKKLVFGYYYQ